MGQIRVVNLWWNFSTVTTREKCGTLLLLVLDFIMWARLILLTSCATLCICLNILEGWTRFGFGPYQWYKIYSNVVDSRILSLYMTRCMRLRLSHCFSSSIFEIIFRTHFLAVCAPSLLTYNTLLPPKVLVDILINTVVQTLRFSLARKLPPADFDKSKRKTGFTWGKDPSPMIHDITRNNCSFPLNSPQLGKYMVSSSEPAN